MQPYHAADDGRWAHKRLDPDRLAGTYAFRSFLDAGAALAFGSDWTVAPLSPIQGIHAAVTRHTLDGANPNGWMPEQKITVDEALAAYTRGVAFAHFREAREGVLKPGMAADLVVLDRDLTTVPAASISQARVMATVVAGKVVFSAEPQTVAR
jgi:predicted amidohydrolase YtcJ